MNQQTTTPGTAGSHAIVIGGSVAGLLAARVLTDHFDHVTIIERDQLPEGAQARKGVPQARHAHGLLIRGRQILEQLFPGLDTDLAANGAPLVDFMADALVIGPAGQSPRVRSDLTWRPASRDLLEACIRRRLVSHPRVQFIQACDVTGLLASADHSRITGVRLRFRPTQAGKAEQDAGSARELSADFVADASGRSSRAPQWLDALGYEAPSETVITSYLGYASRCYARPRNPKIDWKMLSINANPPFSRRGGVILPIEGDRWMVTLAGYARDYPPTSEAGFLEFARSLDSSALYDAIKDAQPLSSIYGYQRTENRRRHYEKLARWPECFVVTGDAACAFNPVYGQGMTTGALDALALDAVLREQAQRHATGDLTGLSRRFQARLAQVTDTPWLMSTGADFRFAATEGGRPTRLMRLTQRYMDRVIMRTVGNPSLGKLFLEVMHLLKPPAALFQPSVIYQVLKPVGRRQLAVGSAKVQPFQLMTGEVSFALEDSPHGGN